ncbi:hypothetical protein [Shivajiella indica]|uniref:Uncharacterized protein n=1 Tax=Shivajiella indica TaxID=872115 RepID=A0ABW5B937_9BACT
MKFKQLQFPESLSEKGSIQSFMAYVNALEEKKIEAKLVEKINLIIDQINLYEKDEKTFIPKLKKARSKIVALVEKEAKLVPIGYYQNQWMALGMAAFGIPFGVMFGIALDNMAFISLGIPFGLSIGLGVGAAQDENAKKNGRQLNVKINI